MTRQEKMKIYKRRRRVLLICVGTVFVLLIAALIICFISGNSEPIKNGADIKTAENSGGRLYFSESELDIAVGETLNAPVVNETGQPDNYVWESTNSAVAIAENGSILGVSEGNCDITVKISGTDYSAQIRVFVEMPSDSVSSENTETGEHTVNVVEGRTYIDGVLIANKSYTLPADYDPGVDPEALEAFREMESDAADEGLDIYISSDYRSYYDQERIYNSYVAEDGAELADTYSSRPGHSDHQTGLAFDLNSIDDSFGYTPESDWVAENAHKYGFIIRFPEGKDEYTGYQYEPWHIRYVGVDMATKIYNSGLSLEEYFGIDSKYDD